MHELQQIAYALIFERDLTDQKLADSLARAIADGRRFAAPTAALVASVDAALREQRVSAQAVEIAGHTESELLGFLGLLRPALTRQGL
jgi:hypothetical protein